MKLSYDAIETICVSLQDLNKEAVCCYGCDHYDWISYYGDSDPYCKVNTRNKLCLKRMGEEIQEYMHYCDDYISHEEGKRIKKEKLKQKKLLESCKSLGGILNGQTKTNS
jgi:hypothetical protein